MCNNIIILYIFLVIKIVAIVFLPLFILIMRKKEFIRDFIYVDIILLLFICICNFFTINKCVYNSNPEGIEKTKKSNEINEYNALHSSYEITSSKVEPDLNYKTYKGEKLYYYNQNSNSIKDNHYECNEEKVYMNSLGSAFTAFATAVSTIYKNPISPMDVANLYQSKYSNICDEIITMDKVYTAFTSLYGGIKMTPITKGQVKSEIMNGNLVIVKLSGNEKSKLTCDSNYIIIYNMDNEGKFKIADPALSSSTYVCPSTSKGYGNIIKEDNMKKSWYIDDIDKEAEAYYLIKGGI